MLNIHSVTTEIIVAKYKESLDWAHGLCLTAYDKSGGNLGIPLPNVGREAHTYLHHICERYDKLADVSYFLQGDPVPHLRYPLSAFLRTTVSGFTPLGFIHDCDGNGKPHHEGLKVDRAYCTLFGREPPEKYWFTIGAVFAVTKEVVKIRPLSFYQAAYRFVLEEEQGPWLLERLWAYVFADSHDPRYIEASLLRGTLV